MESPSLFQRLGGAAGIHRIVDDIVAAHMRNPVIGPRFQPYLETPDKLDAAKQHLRTFLEMGSGGPAHYAGRSMRDTHRGMNISEAEYMAAIDDILGVLERHDIDALARQEVLAIAYSLKGEILHV
jgi:hemoglobin